MKKIEKNLIFILLIIYILLSTYIYSSMVSKYSSLILPIFLLPIALLSYYFFPRRGKKEKYKYEKIQNILIILIIYLIFYYSLGLLFSFNYSIYSNDPMSFLKNSVSVISLICLEEYIRNKLINNTVNTAFSNIVISVIFTLINLNIYSLINNLTPLSVGIRYMSELVLVELVTNFVMNYISFNVGIESSIIYRTFLKMIPILFPIIPSLPWIINAVLGITLPMIIYFNISSNVERFERRIRRNRNEKNKVISNVICIILILLSLFVLKVFHFFPVTILSNSMVPVFERGYVVVVEKLNDKTELQEGDIIYYKNDNRYIVHRITKIKKEKEEIYYITKGDNNNKEDNWKVMRNDILGTVKFSIPYVGLPIVLLNEALRSSL